MNTSSKIDYSKLIDWFLPPTFAIFHMHRGADNVIHQFSLLAKPIVHKYIFVHETIWLYA